MPEPEFVRKDVFDIHVQGLRDRDNADVRISDARFDRMEALLERNIIEQRTFMREINGRVGRLEEDIRDIKKDMKQLRQEIKETREEAGMGFSELKGDLKATNARIDALQVTFGWYLALFGIAITVVLTIVQRFWR